MSSYAFNPFTSNLDIVGSGASYIDGVVATPASLPVTLNTPPLDSVYLAKAGSGVWLISRRPAGLYCRVANNGNANDWVHLGAFPEVNSSANWELFDGSDPTKELKFNLTEIAAGNTRTLTAPDRNGRIGLSDYRVVTGSGSAVRGDLIAANTTAGAFTLTLPASPDNGDTISVLDYAGTFNTNNLTIARNGSNIESLAENMDCNIRNAAFSLVFVGATIGWKVVPYFGSSVNFSSPNAIGNSVPNTGAFTTLTANSLTSGLLSATPAANASGITSTGYSLTGSNAQSLVDLSGTWNTTGTPTAFRLNVTNTASNAASLLMDLQTGGTTQFSVRRDGVINASNYYRFTGLNSGLFVHSAGGGVISIGDSPNNWMTLTSTRMQLTGDLSLGRALSAGQAADTILARDAANTVAQINGTNAQTFRLYNTFTSATNFERLNIIAQSAASVIIGTEKGSGGGSARGLELRTDNVARINISATGGIGFFGAAAAAQPTAVADATDAATVITQLNALLSRMRTLGLIAT